MRNYGTSAFYRRSKQMLLIFVSLTMTGFIGVVRFAGAEPDTVPLVLQNFVMSTSAINVQDGPVQVTMTADIVDNASGYGSIDFYYTSPSGKIVYEGDMGLGNSEATILLGSTTFRQNTEAGTWKPTIITKDASGNKEVLTSASLQARGYNLDVDVTSPNADTTAPTIASITQDQSAIVLENGTPQSVATTIQAADNAPGQGEVYAKYLSPSGQKVSISEGQEYDATTKLVEAIGNWSPYAEGGTWGLYITVCDFVRNCTSYEPSDLQALSLTGTLSVSSTEPDTTPLGIDILDSKNGDSTFDTSFVGGAAISTLIDFSDDLSGVADAMLTFHSQTSNQESESFPLSIGTETGLYYVNATLPPYAASGLWLPSLYTIDNAGNEKTYSHSDLLALGFDVSFTLGASVIDSVPAGGSITTDNNNTGATPEEPIQTAVSLPAAGDVSITTINPNVTSGNVAGYILVGTQVSISAPLATESEPITLNFNIDASQLTAGQNASNVAVFRNGALVAECPGSTVAIPSPCVYSRSTLSGGDIAIGIRTVQASVWSMGFAEPNAVLFQRFLAPLNNSTSNNNAGAGEVVPIKFMYGTNTDEAALPVSAIKSQQINCTTHQTIGAATQVNLNGNGIDANGKRYKFNWKTQKSWKNSCRSVSLSFANGETAQAYFNFNN